MKRNVGNRKIALSIDINQSKIPIFNNIIRWISDQYQHIDFQFKANIDAHQINHLKLWNFLNSNKFIELDIRRLENNLLLEDTLY